MAGYHTKTFVKHDDYMTPKNAWKNIQHIIPKDKVIWECFYGDGTSGEFLKELGFNVIHEDIDFFQNNKGDIIISNPPFQQKKEVFKRLFELNKPFIMICSQALLFTKYFREIVGNETLQLIIPPRRIQFTKLVDGVAPENWINRCNFDCLYFCYKIKLKNDITFL